jgi:hypothetical protein
LHSIWGQHAWRRGRAGVAPQHSIRAATPRGEGWRARVGLRRLLLRRRGVAAAVLAMFLMLAAARGALLVLLWEPWGLLFMAAQFHCTHSSCN